MASFNRTVSKPILHSANQSRNMMRRVHTHDGIMPIYEEDGENTEVSDDARFPMIFRRRTDNERSPRQAAARGMGKNGKFNVSYQHIPNKNIRFAKDLENTLINTRWRWILLCLCIANGIAWLVFAFIWMAIASINGDNDPDVNRKNSSEPFMKCIEGTSHFTGYLLLSIETLTTIGFGTIYPNYCGGSLVALTLQALTGVAIEGVLVTAVYIKMSRPHMTQYQLHVFSKKAVICLRDGKLCLIFRIRDEEGKHRANTKLRVYFMAKRYTMEGEELPNYIESIKLQHYGILMWPLDVVHEIDKDSPMWNISARDLLTEKFELIVMLEGDSLSTGHYCQSQTSYLSCEVNWGYRFIPCVEFCDKKQQYRSISKQFNMTFPYDTPLCSARRLAEVCSNLKALQKGAFYNSQTYSWGDERCRRREVGAHDRLQSSDSCVTGDDNAVTLAGDVRYWRRRGSFNAPEGATGTSFSTSCEVVQACCKSADGVNEDSNRVLAK